jgi:hypothetical protein
VTAQIMEKRKKEWGRRVKLSYRTRPKRGSSGSLSFGEPEISTHLWNFFSKYWQLLDNFFWKLSANSIIDSSFCCSDINQTSVGHIKPR